MKITAVFGPLLYAVHYDGEEENEFEHLMTLWQDVFYVYAVAEHHRVPDKIVLARQFLRENHVFDNDSFQDFKAERDENE